MSAADRHDGEVGLDIPADHPAYAGHFPGAPVLPGVVLLDAALTAIRRGGALPHAGCRIVMAKFFRFVTPGMPLVLRHRALAQGAVDFEISNAGERIATGRFAPHETASLPSSHAAPLPSSHAASQPSSSLGSTPAHRPADAAEGSRE